VKCNNALCLSHITTQMACFIRKKLLKTKCVMNFFTTLNSNISHSMKKSERYYHEHSQVYKQSTCYSCHNLMKLQFSQQIFKQFSNFMQIHLVEAESFHTDGQMLQSQQSPFRVLQTHLTTSDSLKCWTLSSPYSLQAAFITPWTNKYPYFAQHVWNDSCNFFHSFP
jgi:hypothetical protein